MRRTRVRSATRRSARRKTSLSPTTRSSRASSTPRGKFVYLTDEDFEAAKVEGFKTIDIRDFVPYEQIDPIYFRHTYYVGPQDGAERVYALLTKAMDESGLAGITKLVMRDRHCKWRDS
jgi:DNA end-binding protein Ku